jgi:DNA-binding CsgD family transcriptional regulator
MRNFHEQEYPQLLDLIYDAAVDPRRWQIFLDALPTPFGGACGILHFYDVGTSTTPEFRHFGGDPTFRTSYADHFHSINPYPAQRFETMPVGKVMCANDFLDSKVVERTEFYNDLMKPQGITTDHLGVSLHNDAHSATVLGICPHSSVYRKDKGTYKRRLSLLVPHLIRANEINRITAGARMAEQVLGTGLDALRLAAFVVDPTGRLLRANVKAEDLLRRDCVLRTDHSKRLIAANPTEEGALVEAITHAFCSPLGHTTRPVHLTSRATKHAFIAWILPIESERRDKRSHRSQLVHDIRTEKAVLVLVAAAECALFIPPEAIELGFKLSAAEARLASALVAGRTLAEYARESGHSRNTVRNQLASTLEKLEMHRQAELVMLIVGTLGPLAER